MVRVSPLLSWAVLAGLGLGVGLWLVVSRLPRLRAPRLADRVAPFVVDVSDAARELVSRTAVDPLPLLGFALSPLSTAARAATTALLGAGDEVARRLRQAGDRRDPERFRWGQLGWCLAAAGSAAAAIVAVPALRTAPLPAQFALPLLAAAGAFLAKGELLRRRARARLRRIESELPTILEFLALSVAAGEGLSDALRRVARVAHGELGGELGAALAETATGVPLATALRMLAAELRLPGLSRAVEALVAAMERGTPLAEVLLAQARDAREAAKRDLIASAGRKELAMLVPLVFVILPVTVLFAVYPGVFVLHAGFGD